MKATKKTPTSAYSSEEVDYINDVLALANAKEARAADWYAACQKWAGYVVELDETRQGKFARADAIAATDQADLIGMLSAIKKAPLTAWKGLEDELAPLVAKTPVVATLTLNKGHVQQVLRYLPATWESLYGLAVAFLADPSRPKALKVCPYCKVWRLGLSTGGAPSAYCEGHYDLRWNSREERRKAAAKHK